MKKYIESDIAIENDLAKDISKAIINHSLKYALSNYEEIMQKTVSLHHEFTEEDLDLIYNNLSSLIYKIRDRFYLTSYY